MKWLETHVWIATWLGLLVTIAALTLQNAKTGFREIDWGRSLLYLAFVTALAVTFTPAFDPNMRNDAKGLLYATLGAVIVSSNFRRTQA